MEYPTLTKEQINELPLMAYEGKPILLLDTSRMEQCLNDLSKCDLVGFDTETRPSFKKGEVHPVAMVQIACDKNVYLFRIHHCGFIPALADFLGNNAVTKVGIGIREDLKSLKQMRPFSSESFVDLSVLGQKIGISHPSVRYMSAHFLGGRISKSQRVSNWAAPQLRDQQIKYAATDAWVCLMIYQKMKPLLDLD